MVVKRFINGQINYDWCETNYRLPYLKWSTEGEISDVTPSLANKSGFQSKDTFLNEFKNIQRFLYEPSWEFLKQRLNEKKNFLIFPFLQRASIKLQFS